MRCRGTGVRLERSGQAMDVCTGNSVAEDFRSALGCVSGGVGEGR